MCIFENENTQYSKLPNTVRRKNHDFSENKNVLQYENPLKTISEIVIFYVFRSNNTPTVPHQKTVKMLPNMYFLYECLSKTLFG